MRKAKNKQAQQDFPLNEVPHESRINVWSLSILLLGFTFFTATMWGGGTIGQAFNFKELLLVVLVGDLLLGLYVAVLGIVAARTGLSTALLTRFGFGDFGSKWPDILLGFTQIGWYAWGTAMVSIVFVKLLHLPEWANVPFMIFFGIAFSLTAYVGYRGLEKLAMVSVPLMLFLIFLSVFKASNEVGSFSHLFEIEPTGIMTFGAAITIVFGTFVSGGTNATNWTRFARSTKAAAISSLVAFFIGNGLMIMVGAYGALVYQQPDIVEVLALQGLLLGGIVMLFFNIWTTQDNTVYNFSVAGCNFARTQKRKALTIIGALTGTLLAILGFYDWLVPYLNFLGTFIPPVGGVIMADYFYKHRGKYPKLESAKIKSFNIAGILGYVIGVLTAIYSPGIPPLNGILAAIAGYIVIDVCKCKIKFL